MNRTTLHKEIIVIAASLLILSQLAIAQTGLPDNYQYQKLSNGLEVLIIEDSSVPLVHLDMVFRSGSIVESPDLDGLSHLYEHMIFNASEKYPTGKLFNDKLLGLGILSNAYTGQEVVSYYFSLPSKNLKPSLELFAEGILHPLFLASELDIEKKSVKSELEIIDSDPYLVLNSETDQKLWGKFFSRKDVSGDYSIIFEAKQEQLSLLKERYHHPNNALLIIAGDIHAEDVLKEVIYYFGEWPAIDKNPYATNPIPTPTSLPKSVYFSIEHEELETPAILYRWQGPAASEDMQSMLSADLFFELINLESSTFYENLVEEDLVHEYYGGSTPSKYASSLSLELYPNPAKLSKAMLAIESEIDGWITNAIVTDEKLNIAKKMIMVTEAYEQEELSEYIHKLSERWSIGGIDLLLKYQTLIDQMQPQDLSLFLNRYIKDKPKAVGVAIAPDQIEELNKAVMKDYFNN